MSTMTPTARELNESILRGMEREGRSNEDIQAVREYLQTPDRNTPPIESIANDTVCLKLWFNTLGTSRKADPGEVDVQAEAEVVKLSKRILQCDELKAIRQADSAFKAELEHYCVQGLDIGVRIVKHSALERVYELCEQFAPRRQELVDQFIAAYPRLCEEDQQRLTVRTGPAGTVHNLHNPEDYPPVEVVRTKFAFAYRALSFGAPEKLRMLSPRIFQEERQKAAHDFAQAAELAQQALLTKFSGLVKHLREKLTPDADGKPKRIHPAAVDNIKEAIAEFSFQNVGGYADLEAEVERLQNLLGDTDSKELRQKEDWRNAVNADLAEIETNLSAMVEHRPIRKIRFTAQ
jgi:hypothetical protein